MDKESLIREIKILSEQLRCGLMNQEKFDKEVSFLIRYKLK